MDEFFEWGIAHRSLKDVDGLVRKTPVNLSSVGVVHHNVRAVAGHVPMGIFSSNGYLEKIIDE